MGLNVNSTRLATIADNIANSSTNGYKRSVTDFASVVTHEAGASYQAGGVRSISYKLVDHRASLASTTNATDLALLGPGLIPVTPVAGRDEPVATRELQFVTTGSFTPDSEGYLRTRSGHQLLGFRADDNGDIPAAVVRESGASLWPITIAGLDFANSPTTRLGLGVNLPSADTAGAAGTAHVNHVEYYDSLGASQTLTLTFTTTGVANAWDLTVVDSATGAAAVGEADLTFNATGAAAGYLSGVTATTGIYGAATGLLTVAVGGGAGQTIDIDLGVVNQRGNLTQFASAFAPVAVTKDGVPVSAFDHVEVNEAGMVEALYTTGMRRTIAQIPVAMVPHPNGMLHEDNQAFSVSASSGPLYLWNAGDGGAGAMVGFTLEQSSVDIAEELTQLIETQRAYSSNAKIIQTVDEMMQETTMLKR